MILSGLGSAGERERGNHLAVHGGGRSFLFECDENPEGLSAWEAAEA
jgi:hypothetical protein